MGAVFLFMNLSGLEKNLSEIKNNKPSEQVLSYGYVIDNETGMLENKSYPYAFNVQKKLAFCDLISKGFGTYKALASLNVSHHSYFEHCKIDSKFKELVKHAEKIYIDSLESVSRENALNPKSVIERIFLLKNLLPFKYADNKQPSQAVTINIDSNLLASISERSKVIDAELVKPVDNATLPISERSRPIVASDSKAKQVKHDAPLEHDTTGILIDTIKGA